MRPNIHAAAIDQDRREVAGYHAARARLGEHAGAQQLGLSLWILPPGQAAYPYHFHLVEEELLIVLDGTPTLRTPAGTRVLQTGEVVAFPVGEHGAHQVLNDTDADVRFLAISTSGEPEIVVYPDEGKVGANDRGDGAINHYFRLEDAVDYYEGIEPR
mgnify:CR=1 FL=1